MSKFRGEPAQGSQSFTRGQTEQPVGKEFEEDVLDEELAGMPDLAASWYSRFGPVLVFVGVVSNVMEVLSSAGGTVQIGMTNLSKQNMFNGVTDMGALLSTAVHNFPLMLVVGVCIAVFCQSGQHLFAQPVNVSIKRIMTLAQKKKLWDHAQKHLTAKMLFCCIAIAGNAITNAVFLYALYGSWVILGLGCLLLPFMSTYALYHGLAMTDEAKTARIVKEQATAIELDVLRQGMSGHYQQQYYGARER